VARALAPELPHRVVGIRPGEKMHEVMCPEDDSHLTIAFDDHYVIRPSIQFAHQVDFMRNRLGETGVPVEIGFEFSSNRNERWFTPEELLEQIALTESEEQ
jgi:UDP-N-acetylglucosamine 4,6-dehydratase